MPSTYESTPLSHYLHVERERISAIDLTGIPQIPDEADRWWKYRDEELPTALQRQCDQAIAEAMAEHQRRRLAKLRGSTYGSASRFRRDEEEDTDNEEELD